MKFDVEQILLEEPISPPRIVEVAWLDAESQSDYSRVGELRQTGMVNYDVGYVVAESDNWLVIGQERYHAGRDDIGGFRRTIGIPKVLIRTLTNLYPVTSSPSTTS